MYPVTAAKNEIRILTWLLHSNSLSCTLGFLFHPSLFSFKLTTLLSKLYNLIKKGPRHHLNSVYEISILLHQDGHSSPIPSFLLEKKESQTW